jgi:hypothetical protein
MPIPASDIINIIRNVTGRVDPSDPLFTDTIMLQYLNNFIVQLSSQDIRLFKNMTWLEFDISPITPNPYPIDLQVLKLTTIGPPAYCQLIPIVKTNTITNVNLVGLIDGVNTVFTLQATPFIVPLTFEVTGSSPAQVMTDDGLGMFTGNGVGTINYNSGQIEIVFNNPPAISSTVQATYDYELPNQIPQIQSPQFSLDMAWYENPELFYQHWPDRLIFTPQRPTAVLYYNNALTFRGPPNREYHIKIQAYHEEVSFGGLLDVGIDYLYRYLAYGTSLDIFSDFGEMDKWQDIYPAYTRYRSLVYARTYSQYQNQRTTPEF